MPDLLKQYSIQIEISGNAPLLLTNPEYIYLVSSESVDVFVTALQDNQPYGARSFLFRAAKGSLLCGLDPDGFGSGLGLIVTGKPGSSVLQVSRSRLQEASRDQNPEVRKQITNLVQDWIANLTLALDQGVPPKDTTLLGPGSHVLQPGENAKVKAGSGNLWLIHTQGKSSFCSQPYWQLTSKSGYIPFSEQAWVTAVEEVHLECFSQEQYQQKDPGYEHLENFHRLFFKFVRDQQAWLEQEEKGRLEEMARMDQARLSSTMSLLAEAMEMKQDGLAQETAAGDDLLAACRRVGQEIGLEIHEPSGEARINTDPLQAIAKGSNFRIRQVALKGEWWKSDAGPMLGFLNDARSGEERPVALLQPTPGSYVLEDIQTGSRRKVDKGLNNELSFFAYSFYCPLPNRPLKALDMLRFGLFKLRRDQAMLLLMAIFAALLGLLPPIANGIIFDTLIPEADRPGLLFLGAILVSAAIATGLFEAIRAFSTMRIVGKMDFRLQSGVMDRLLSLPTPFFRNYTAGDLADRTLGINAIREILSGATLSSMMGGIFSSFSLALLFYYSWQLALVAIGITLVAMCIVGGIGYVQVSYQRSIQHLQGKLQGMVLQFISGISKLRVSGTEDRAFSTWAETFSSMRKATFKAVKISNHLHAFGLTLPVISLFLIFGWIFFTPLLQELSLGAIVAFNSAFTQFLTAMVMLANTSVSSLQVIPLYERAQPILQATPEVDSGKSGPGVLTGQIEANNICFRYDPDGPLILKDVSLAVDPGEFAAVVGGSGSGKSTLLRLFLGFERPESGSIYYDSQDLDNLDVVAVRRQLGVVLQNGSVMPGDIFSNIVGSSNLSLDHAWEAARMSGLDQDIQNMPMGMHTMITPGGGTLSGGQRQRLLIARAIVHKPRVLYFDEATSALDNATQKTVSQSLEQLNATRVVIAHRLSTIKNAHRIFVLDKGTLVQQGTYSELMEQPGLFEELARRQLA